MYETNINILDLIEDIKRAMKADAWFSALSLTFALVSKCGKVQYNNSDSYNFIHWVDDYITKDNSVCWEKRPNKNGKMTKKVSHQVRNYNNSKQELDISEPYMNGELLYQLRCALLHGASDNVKFNELSHCKPNTNIKSYNFHYQISTQYIEMGWSNIQSSVDCYDNYSMTVPIDGLIWPIILSVEEYYNNNQDKFNKITIIDYRQIYGKEV